MSAVGVGSLAMLLMLASFVLLIIALVDLARRPAHVWERSGHNQLVWALIVIFVGFIGPVLYLLVARPALHSAEREVPLRRPSVGTQDR